MTRRRRGSLLACGLAGLASGMASAAIGQGVAPPCVLDRCMPGAVSPPRSDTAPSDRPQSGLVPRAPLSPGSFDFYVLTLSWSPAFCEGGSADKSPDQCAAGRNPGFVVHGLWPQNQHGYPSDCDAGSRFPSRAAIDGVRDLYPDPGLARHEWRAHGTCSGLAPTAYFATVRQARAMVAIPPALQAPSEPQTLTPIAIARAFASSNPGLRPDQLAVTCRQGELEDVRLCLAKDLRGYVSCPEVARATCRTGAVMVVPGR